jgi:cation diffusion facilitator family transporter
MANTASSGDTLAKSGMWLDSLHVYLPIALMPVTAQPNKRPLTHYAALSLGAAIATFLMKLLAWRLTNSVSILSDALETIANIAAAFITFAALWVAVRPEDEEHAFGHSKVEYFASGTEGVLIVVAAVVIAWAAIERFLSPHPIQNPVIGLGILAAASFINLGVAAILLRAGRERDSIALRADSKHLMTDVWTSGAVLVAVVIVTFTGWLWLDPLLGLGLAVYIFITGAKLVRESMGGLMDSRLPPSELEAIRVALGEYASEGIQFHALRTRRAAAMKFATVHMLMPGAWTIAHGHSMAERVEKDLRSAVPGLIVVTHLEPEEDLASWRDVKLERTDES